MVDPFATGLSVLRRAFGQPVTYTGAGLVGETVSAIPSHTPADELLGFQGKGARLSFEIEYASLPGQPSSSDRIEHGGVAWQVSDINRRDDVGAFVLFVRKP